ncbi:1-aminocyclopropane-1-carboxylate deaminase/D-cysteine desulfhydrase [Shewanella sp. AS1]|uniref:1-aminocyclopropane-1-carboxylate deaminase/D-cysteine desulfhydrase n=1 Tax=Shewanella sp. AS1 TaxID=2907626 RepID=UPI001F3F11B1|nr:1-aminocyclopropane-1-carboxylate deaminase/D-cysteine desulfhydrase [Shewanella sp. AS1]MCE9678571.1 1-aminocyclopropane-1-carboxylate deaminase/D-cysteine desulfhydrase [Shewanella sp. AS1]
MKLSHTPVDQIGFDQYGVFVKRDDLLHPEFSGNKARKFAYFLDQTFPGITHLVGYGSPQANSLYSMSALAKLKGWQLCFYVDHIASHLRDNPIGNYRAALENGAEIIDLSQAEDRQGRDTLTYIQEQVLPGREDMLFVPEGGRCQYAEVGVTQLAREIIAWKQQQALKSLMVFLPSGTGTTALFLNKAFCQLDPSIQVYTCAVVGSEHYLRLQFSQLENDSASHPVILPKAKPYHFGKLYPEFYQIWRKLSCSGIEFELLYDPLGWLVLAKQLPKVSEEAVLYVHQGGLLGNESMLPRYLRKYG